MPAQPARPHGVNIAATCRVYTLTVHGKISARAPHRKLRTLLNAIFNDEVINERTHFIALNIFPILHRKKDLITMEVVYSIGVSNRFLLDMDTVSDPQDIFVEKEQRMKEKKEKSSKPKQPKPIKKAEPVKKAPEPEQKSRKEGMNQTFSFLNGMYDI